MDVLQIFTFGYDGWGSSTDELKWLVDLVERSRGYEPPFFVDIRMARGSRAAGFKNREFESLLGSGRYRWMKELGNKNYSGKAKPRIKISDPDAVEEVLGMALARKARRQRLILFCSCADVGRAGGRHSCHRSTVASMLLKTATKRNVRLEIAEWPGGEPKNIRVKIDDASAAKLLKNAANLILAQRPSSELLSLPFGSVVEFKTPTKRFFALADPAVYRGNVWKLPIPAGADTERDRASLSAQSRNERTRFGLSPRFNY